MFSICLLLYEEVDDEHNTFIRTCIFGKMWQSAIEEKGNLLRAAHTSRH